MTEFILFTTGRTGSSAIAEEMRGHSNIQCRGEILRPVPEDKRAAAKEYYELTVQKNKNDGQFNDVVLPYMVFADHTPGEPISDEGVARYFEYLRSRDPEGTLATGFKLIDNGVINKPVELCQRLGISLIYLARRNILRKVISGSVAREVKCFNKVGYTPEAGRKFNFKPETIIKKIHNIQRKQDKYKEYIGNDEPPFLYVYYEDWVQDPSKFQRSICDFLKVPVAEFGKSTLSVMTPEPLTYLLENYEEIASEVTKAGFGDFLKE